MNFRRLVVAGAILAFLFAVPIPGSLAQGAESSPDLTKVLNRQPLAYVMMGASNSVAVIDLGKGDIVERIDVPANPHGGAITPDGRFIYAASMMGSDHVHVVDLQDRKVVAQIDIGNVSHHAAISPDGRTVYVSAGEVVAIDTASNEVVARIETEEMPYDLVFTPDGRWLYVSGQGSTIMVIDPNTNQIVKTIALEAEAMMSHLAFRPDGSVLYATNDLSNTVTVIDVAENRPVAAIDVGKEPHGIAIGSDGRYAVVANRGETTYSVIDTKTLKVVATREAGRNPQHVTATPDGELVLMGVSPDWNGVLVIDPATATTVARIETGESPHAFLFAPTKKTR